MKEYTIICMRCGKKEKSEHPIKLYACIDCNIENYFYENDFYEGGVK